jgi:hypothetical protein
MITGFLDVFRSRSPRSRVRIRGQVRFQCEEVGDGSWVAECDALNVTILASSFSGLVEDIVPTLDAMLEDLRSTGDLETVLSRAGLSAEPDDIASAGAFDLPFSTDIRRHAEDSAHALAV